MAGSTTRGAARPAVARSPRLAQVSDLMPLLPGEGELPLVRPQAPRSWSFAAGLPGAFAAGPAGVRVSVSGDGVRLHGASEPPWVELCEPVDPVLWAAMRVVLHPASGTEAELVASTRADRFRADYRTKAAFPAPGETLTLPLPHPESVDGPLACLRLYPGGVTGSASVAEVSLVPRHPGFVRKQVLERPLAGPRNEFRKVRVLRAGETVELATTAPAGARLSAGIASIVAFRASRVIVEVSAKDGAGHEGLRTPVPGPSDGWLDVALPLPQGPVKIGFRLEADDPGAFALLGGVALLAPEPDRRASVFLIVADTLRADHLSCYGDPRTTSPHLDRLARQGTLHAAALAPSSWTLPSMAAMFTGASPASLRRRHGWHGPIPADLPPLAERLSAGGYVSAAFVGNALLGPFQGYARGFATYVAAPAATGQLPGDALEERAGRWMAAHAAERLFVFAHFMDSHEPYDAPGPGRAAAPYRIDRISEGSLWPVISEQPSLLAPGGPGALEAAYAGDVAAVDGHVGRLLARLRRLALWDEAAVLFTADHGEELAEHGYWGHGCTLYEESLGIPFLVRDPSAPRGGRVHFAAVTLEDVMPTILELAKLPVEAGDGLSVLAAHPDRDLVHETWAFGPVRIAVRSGALKYVFFDRASLEAEPSTPEGRWLAARGPAAEELYDLASDPEERRNLVAARPEEAARLRSRARELLREGEAPAPEEDGEMAERLRALGYLR